MMTRDDARTARRNALARIIAAERMDLMKDTLGEHLPPDLWKQMLPRADAIMLLIHTKVEPL